MTSKDKLIQVALGEIGYLEKASNKDLDDKVKNAGNKNFTKYARDLVKMVGSPYAQGAAWCDMFVDWCFVKAFGLEQAKNMLGGWSAYTPTSANYYKNANRWFTTPSVGDQIFFKNSQRICHTGIVIEVTSGNVITVEGNTSSEAGVISNGGCVRKKQYKLGYKDIAGYGRPLYFEVEKYTGVLYDGVDITEALNPKAFNAEKYRATYADLNAAFGDNWPDYYKHFVMFGKDEIATGKRPKFM